jgi:hypothetical protein
MAVSGTGEAAAADPPHGNANKTNNGMTKTHGATEPIFDGIAA